MNNKRVQSWKPIPIRNWLVNQFQQVQHESEKWRLKMRFSYSILQSISPSSHRKNISWNQLSFSSGFIKSQWHKYCIHGKFNIFSVKSTFCQKSTYIWELSHIFWQKFPESNGFTKEIELLNSWFDEIFFGGWWE